MTDGSSQPPEHSPPQPPPGAPTPPPGAPAPPPAAPTPPPAAPTPPGAPAPGAPASASGADLSQPIPAPGAPGQPAPGAPEQARPAFGAPPPGAPGSTPEEPKKKRIWPWILLGVVVLLLLLVGGCSLLLFNAANEPVDAGESFMTLVQGDQGSQAYDALAPLCQTNDRPGFEQLANGIDLTAYDLNPIASSINVNQDTSSAVVEGTATIGGGAQPLRLDLTQVDGDWRVCSFIIGDTIYTRG